MNEKKLARMKFRLEVFQRDRYCCVMCEKPGMDRQDPDAHKEFHNKPEVVLDDVRVILDVGFVKENGGSLCEECHIHAEQFHICGEAFPGYAPDDLYAKIGSSFEKACEAAAK